MTRLRVLSLSVAVLCAVSVLGLAGWIARPVPAALLAPVRTRSITIADRNGVPLRTTRGADGTLAEWTPYDRIDPDVINAFVAVEDKRFWEHHGSRCARPRARRA